MQRFNVKWLVTGLLIVLTVALVLVVGGCSKDRPASEPVDLSQQDPDMVTSSETVIDVTAETADETNLDGEESEGALEDADEFGMEEDSFWSSEDFQIADLSMLSSEAEVFNRLGQPTAVEEGKKKIWIDEDELFYKVLTYPGVTVELIKYMEEEGFVVNSFSVSSKEYPTYRGIAVGDTAKNVLSVYGEADYQGGHIEYQAVYEQGEYGFFDYLRFVLDGKNRVVRIEIGPVVD